ncbi:MAG: signal recognition particle protein, partial [Hyphomicrobiales bacterium]|nr:signal recognition particle protein [Hyphomicrobiales bacterium]
GKRGPMGKMAQMFGMGGGMPSPEEIAKLQEQAGAGGKLPPTMPKLPATPPGLNLPKNMPGGLPGLGGFNPFAKKK